MSCVEVRAQAGAYLDRELDHSVRLDIDRHLSQCTACSTLYFQQDALQTLVLQHAPDFTATAELRARIEAALPSAQRAPLFGSLMAFFPALKSWRFAASLALCAGLTWGIATHFAGHDIEEDLIDSAVTVHMRSLTENHLVDLASAEPGKVQQWFKDRLSYAAPIKDLSGTGYALVGGRLDYLYKRPLAAVVYRSGDNLINVLVWPVSKSDHFPSSLLVDERIKIMFWVHDGRNYCAISDLSEGKFTNFVKAFKAA